MRKVIERGITQIQKFGAIPYSYKTMGASPRVIPQSYGTTVNNAKKVVRIEAYTHMAKHFHEEGYAIFDCDLKSCFTSLLLGLYPDEMIILHDIIKGPGLWKSIEKEFIEKGAGAVFNKPAVKVCVYSALFQGGNKAMMNAVLENNRKEVGMTDKIFKDSAIYESCYNNAQKVVTQMMNSQVINSFRSVASYVLKNYRDEELIGPTGHRFLINNGTFRSAYPNFLQSYEFALIAGGTVNYLKKREKSEIIGHFHDGNVLAIPIESYAEDIQLLQQEITGLGRTLGLKYPQELEVQRIFPEETQ